MQTLYRCLRVTGRRNTWIEYYLLTDTVYLNGAFVEEYGVEVVFRSPDSVHPLIARVPKVTPKLSKMLQLLQILSLQAVTPASLKDSLSELL